MRKQYRKFESKQIINQKNITYYGIRITEIKIQL